MRLEWARDHFQLDTQYWKEIIFTDYEKFNFDCPDGLQCYRYNLRKEPELFPLRVSEDGSFMI